MLEHTFNGEGKKGAKNDGHNRKSGNSPVCARGAHQELLLLLLLLPLPLPLWVAATSNPPTHFFGQTLRGYRAMARQMQLQRPRALRAYSQTRTYASEASVQMYARNVLVKTRDRCTCLSDSRNFAKNRSLTPRIVTCILTQFERKILFARFFYFFFFYYFCQ